MTQRYLINRTIRNISELFPAMAMTRISFYSFIGTPIATSRDAKAAINLVI